MFKSCILFLADGARPDVLEDLLRRGNLPNIASCIVEPGSYRRANTAFPSTTGPAYLPFLTGRFPGPCNVPGIRWFDRDRYRRWGMWGKGSFRSYVGGGGFLMNTDLDPATPTLFDLFDRPACIFSSVNRGAGFLGNRTKTLHAMFWIYAHFTDRWDRVDRAALRLIRSALRRRPDFIYAVFPGVDEYAHLRGPFSDQALESYRTLDRAIGEVCGLLRQEGRLSETLLVLTSDHGLSDTHTHFDPGDFLNGRGYKTLHYPLVARNRAAAAYMVSGNAMAHVYLEGPEGWGERLCYDAVRSGREDLVGVFLEREEIDLVIGRRTDGEICVAGGKGEAFIREDAEGRIHYRTTGADPLGYGPMPPHFSREECLDLTFDTLHPDAPVQVLQLFRSGRTGDLVLSARRGYDLRSNDYEHPEHRASHGSLDREHMHVPFAINARVNVERLRTVDVFPTILRLTGREGGYALDGKAVA